MINVVQGNLVNKVKEGYYIAHQCNMCTGMVLGVARDIYTKYPRTNKRNGKRYNLDKFGTVEVVPVEFGNDGGVINMYAQFYPGMGYEGNIVDFKGNSKENMDSTESREEAFKKCLEAIRPSIVDGTIKKLAFPLGIGCGLAKGNWKNYNQMIEDFSKTVNIEILYVSKD